jgi:hypothetical protein
LQHESSLRELRSIQSPANRWWSIRVLYV